MTPIPPCFASSIASKDVFPPPFGPTSMTISPFAKLKQISFSEHVESNVEFYKTVVQHRNAAV